MACCPVKNERHRRNSNGVICVQKKTGVSFDPEDIPRPLNPVLLRIAHYLIVSSSLLVRHKGAAPIGFGIPWLSA
jgi:hypothetical protein